MENSRIEDFSQKMENLTVESLKKRLIKSCVDFNETQTISYLNHNLNKIKLALNK
jgi:hypothetical protein